MQIITSTGFGDSGSSAITDLISEYDGIKSYGSEWECTFLHAPDGLGDLENAINEGHRLKTDFAIKRFLKLAKKLNNQEDYKKAFKGQFYNLSLSFINDIAPVKWNGMYEDLLLEFNSALSYKDRKFIDFSNTYYNLKKSKKFDMYESDSWRPSYVPFTDMYYANDVSVFYSAAQKYTKALLELAAEGSERLYLDQLIPPISVKKYLNYIPFETKVFVVDKDPRDLFLVENLYNGSRFVPFEDVNVFINWYKATRKKAKEEQLTDNKYFCLLDDLVFNYDEQCVNIENFLKIFALDHKKKFSKFDPKKSSVNIQLYNKYTNFEDEIKEITKYLQNFLSKYSINLTFVEKNNGTKLFSSNPIKNVLVTCNDIQDGNVIASRFIISLNSTYAIKNLRAIKYRKSFVKKIKAIIKMIIGLLFFLPQLIINLFIIIIGK